MTRRVTGALRAGGCVAAGAVIGSAIAGGWELGVALGAVFGLADAWQQRR